MSFQVGLFRLAPGGLAVRVTARQYQSRYVAWRRYHEELARLRARREQVVPVTDPPYQGDGVIYEVDGEPVLLAWHATIPRA